MLRFLPLFFLCISLYAKQEQHTFSKEDRARFVKEAAQYEQDKEYNLAIGIYLKLYNDDKLNYEYMLKLGILYYRKNDLKDAEFYFKRILRFRSDDIEAKIWLGRIRFREEKYSQAENYLAPVFEKHPNYTEVGVLLSRVYQAQGKREKALETLRIASKSTTYNPSLDVQMGHVYANDEKYHLAYKEYQRAWELSNREPSYLAPLFGVREYARPSIKTAVSYSQEREIDLVTQILTTQINTWFTSIKYTLPVSDNLRIYALGGYSPEQQFNKVSQLNNYYANNYWSSLGLDFQYRHLVRIKGQSNLKWGTNNGPNNIFPFKGSARWEPLLSISLSPWNIRYTAAVIKESFIGRDFTDIVSFYVDKRSVMNAFSARFFDGKLIVGGEGSLSNYYGSRFNKLKEFNAYAMNIINRYPVKFAIEYKYLFATFQNVDNEYFSYRARYRHFGTFRAWRVWKGKGSFEARYTFKWQKLREFVNVAEEISVNNARPPEELLLNILQASEIEGIARFNLREHFSLFVSAQYYADTNKYKTLGGRLGLDIYF